MFFELESTADLAASKFKNLTEQVKELQGKLDSFVISKDMETIYKNVSKQFVSMNDNATKLVRSMGGVFLSTKNSAEYANAFRMTLMDAVAANKELGVTFKDANETVQSLADAMGRMVNPSAAVVSDMVVMAKSTGLSNAEIGGMVANISKFGGTQSEALKTMSGIAMEARKTGINTAAYMKNVSENLKKASGFGFQSGIEGVKTMAKQAAMLRTSIESIGAKGLQAKVLDPEGAMEAAAGFQMLGGAVGKLGDPFQLLHMAQSDMAGLQNELVKSTSSAFKFNKETGRFDASTQDLYRLRQQAEITGANFDDMLESGKEAAKLDFLKNAVDLSSLNEEQQGLINSLSEIGADGKIMFDLPGYDEQGKNLQELMKEAKFKAELDKYQMKEGLSEKQIAMDQMTIEEDQLAALLEIQQAIVLGLDKGAQETFRQNLIKANENAAKQGTSLAQELKKTSGEYVGLRSGVDAKASESVQVQIATDVTDALDTTIASIKNQLGISDGLFPSNGSAPTIISKGAIYKGIVGDDVAVGEGLGKALNSVSSGTGGGNVGGKIDININLTGSIGGDPGQITKMFNSPQVQKQIMDTVLYKLNDYKRQQGVLS
jgi:hypothetical protein